MTPPPPNIEAVPESPCKDNHAEKSTAAVPEAGVRVGPEEIMSSETWPITPEAERRVVRKIDRFLMPAMMIGYGLVYYDKAILGSAALFGMTTDLQLAVTDPVTGKTDTSRLSWATSIFYFGQLIGSYPMTYTLQRFDSRFIFGPAVLIWAVICAATAGVGTWQGLLVQRFFLGFTESLLPTTFMTLVSSYYTQREQSLRQTWWFSGTGWFTVLGAAFNYGFAQITPSPPHTTTTTTTTTKMLKSWQYIYIFAGALTFLFGIWTFFLPFSPRSAWFLTPEDRVIAVERLRKGQTGMRSRESSGGSGGGGVIKSEQIREALFDGKVWLVALMMGSAYTVNGAITGFGPLIVTTFGYSSLESILFQLPLGIISAIGIPFAGYFCGQYPNKRIITLTICCLPVIAGYVVIWKSRWGSYRPAAPVVGYTLVGFFGPVVGLVISLGASNVAGETKKSFMAAAVFVAYCVGNIVGPLLVRSETRSEHYPALWTGLIIFYVVTISASSALYVLLSRENKRRERLGLDERESGRFAFKDLTDKENPHFRYVL